ncbi:MAG TPA: hypothetical protein VMW83_07465 [Spirochaetia bacterium]|nr:hypothetical protein [Spirochaetia bacterium]
MAKETIVSLRLDPESQSLLALCRELGQFDTATDTLLAGLRLLARDLRRQQIRQEIQSSPDEVREEIRTYSLIGLKEWADNIERADRGEL